MNGEPPQGLIEKAERKLAAMLTQAAAWPSAVETIPRTVPKPFLDSCADRWNGNTKNKNFTNVFIQFCRGSLL